jgi:hypothetical protein
MKIIKLFEEFINEKKEETWFFYLNDGTTKVKEIIASSEKDAREKAYNKFNPQESNFIEMYGFTTDLKKLGKSK